MTLETTFVTDSGSVHWETEEDAENIVSALTAGEPVYIHIEDDDKNLYLKMLAYIPAAMSDDENNGTSERFYFAASNLSDYINLDLLYVTDDGKLAIVKAAEIM